MRIKNWRKFQHFKDRRPPWIKLYRGLLDDRDWHHVNAESAKAMVAFWLIASENDGTLPNTADLAFRLRTTEEAIEGHYKALSHWLEQDYINLISERYQLDAPETETETETEKSICAPVPAAPTAKKFTHPTLEEVKAYCLERKNRVDAQKWLDHYVSNGWKVGKNAMNDWRAAVRTWERSDIGVSPEMVRTAANRAENEARRAARITGKQKAEIARVFAEGCKTVDEFLGKSALIEKAMKETCAVFSDVDHTEVMGMGLDLIRGRQ